MRSGTRHASGGVTIAPTPARTEIVDLMGSGPDGEGTLTLPADGGGGAVAEAAAESWLRDGNAPHVLFLGLAFLTDEVLTIDTDEGKMTLEPRDVRRARQARGAGVRGPNAAREV